MCPPPPGREWSDWSSELRIPGDELKWKFISDGSVNGWGWRFTVYPIMPAAGEWAGGLMSFAGWPQGPHEGLVASSCCVGSQLCAGPMGEGEHHGQRPIRLAALGGAPSSPLGKRRLLAVVVSCLSDTVA